MNSISNKAAIVGIGSTVFSKDSGRTELDMAAEAILAALDEAGLVPDDIDGIVTHTDDSSDEIAIARTLGIDNLTFFGQCRWDGAGCAMIMRAAIGSTIARPTRPVLGSMTAVRGPSPWMVPVGFGSAHITA